MLKQEGGLKKKAFTIVEVLVASVVITITAVAVYTAMTAARSASFASRNRERASALVEERLNELIRFSVRDLKQFATKYPDGKTEALPAELYRDRMAEAQEENENLLDYTPRLPQPQMVTRIFKFSDSCKVEVTLSWLQPGLGERISESGHFFKYRTER